MSKTIVITGVGKRIGLYLARKFIEQGHHVIGTYRSHYPSIIELQETGADLYPCDFIDNVQLASFIDIIKSKYESVDCIIHNASLWLADNAELPLSEILDTMMQVHVNAPYQINLAFESLLNSATKQANIIHITDFVAQKGSKKHIAYAASKAALENMTLSFATKLAPKVKVNSIAPALICFNDDDDDEYKAKAKKKSLMAREAGNHEVLATIEYLMSSEYVTGRSLALDGGRHLK